MARTLRRSVSGDGSVPVRRVVVAVVALTLLVNVGATPATGYETDYSEYPMLERRWSGDDWIRLHWNVPTIEGYDRVRVTLTNKATCETAPAYRATYEGTADSVTFTGVAADGAYDYWAETLDADGNSLGRNAGSSVLMASRPVVKVDPIAGPVVAGQPVTVTGRITRWRCLENRFEPMSRVLWLEQRAVGAQTWSRVDSAKSRGWWDTVNETEDVLGRVWFEQQPVVNTEYRLVYDGLRDEQPAASDSTSVAIDGNSQPTTMNVSATAYQTLPSSSARRGTSVRPRVSAILDDARVMRGSVTRIRGRVRPSHDGRYVYLQRRTPEGWKTFAARRLNSESRYTFRLEFGSAGERRLRVVRPADRNNAQGRSPVRALEVTRR